MMKLETQHTNQYYNELPRLPHGHSSPGVDYHYLYQNQNHHHHHHHHDGPPHHESHQDVHPNLHPNPMLHNVNQINNYASTTTSAGLTSNLMNPLVNNLNSRSHHPEGTPFPVNFPSSLRSNSWDGQAMMPYPWNLNPNFTQDRHRTSQPDITQPNPSYHQQPSFNSLNFNPNLYQNQSELNALNHNRFAYDNRSYQVLPDNFSYGKPYDKPTPQRSMSMFGEPAFSDRPHLCQIPNCGRMFKRLEHLKRHHRSIHTSERPYPCRFPKCSKAFSRSDNLAQHMRIHRQDPPAAVESRPKLPLQDTKPLLCGTPNRS